MQESRLTVALDKRFDDIEEIKDVANHGCAGGVSDFIYYYETRAFFNEYEEEIEQELEELYGDDYLKQILKTSFIQDVTQLKNHMVWSVVSIYCTDKAYS